MCHSFVHLRIFSMIKTLRFSRLSDVLELVPPRPPPPSPAAPTRSTQRLPVFHGPAAHPGDGAHAHQLRLLPCPSPRSVISRRGRGRPLPLRGVHVQCLRPAFVLQLCRVASSRACAATVFTPSTLGCVRRRWRRRRRRR